MSNSSIQVFEVGPRDGLQNEKHILPLADKVWLVNQLVKSGIQNIETGAFVRPDKVMQMAESELLHAQLSDQLKLKANFWYLVPNEKGLERALAAGVTNIALFSAVSETFNKNNIGMSVEESFAEMEDIITIAKEKNIKVRGYVSTVWGCPFEGRIAASHSLKVIERMLTLGVEQVSIGDTIGVAVPKGTKEILSSLSKSVGAKFSEKVAVHFHDTRGTALANAAAALELGVRTFDSSIGGLGGCPFAPGAAGNLATEDLVYFMKEMGMVTNVNYSSLCETSIELSQKMGKPIKSKALQAFVANCEKNKTWDA